ncbi:MAG: tetratricopeptide repeat protein [Elainella sp. Prado103]|jgi:tetratricopeptide (TPR) repeat protein|nr:tetratricopeptide repeat protein [Elainella sp. Prado103]
MRYFLPVSVVSLALFTALLTLLPLDRPVPLVASVVWAQTVEERKAEGDRLFRQGIQLQAALVIVQEIGDQRREKSILNQIAEIYQLLGQTSESLAYYEQALEIFQQVVEQADISIGRSSGSLSQAQQTLNLVQEISHQLAEGARSRR